MIHIISSSLRSSFVCKNILSSYLFYHLVFELAMLQNRDIVKMLLWASFVCWKFGKLKAFKQSQACQNNLDYAFSVTWRWKPGFTFCPKSECHRCMGCLESCNGQDASQGTHSSWEAELDRSSLLAGNGMKINEHAAWWTWSQVSMGPVGLCASNFPIRMH